MEILDFEMEIGDLAGHGYPVTARAPAGEASASMRLPLTREELDHQLAVINDAVLASSAIARRVATDDEQPVQQFGRQLFDALVTDDVRALYVASAQRARDEGASLRLVLRIRSPELARLPWEFLFDPGRQDYLGLTLPLVRFPQVLVPRQPLQAAAPLRILGMVSRPNDQDPLAVNDEKRRLRTALDALERSGQIELTWVGGQTYGDLEDALDQGPWHAFHFVGHGGYDRESDEGTIALAGEDGRTDAVGADDLSRLLGEHYTLRLVVLNACETGRGGALDVFSSTAGALVRRGIPAVVAMQFAISDDAAIRFAQTFYQNVAKRLPIDTSVMRARRALRRTRKNTLEWGTPVLYLRAPDGQIFSPAAPAPAASGDADRAAPLLVRRRPEQSASAEAEALYDRALAAFWTERWDQAVDLLRQVLVLRPSYPEAERKLDQARRQQQLAAHYEEGLAAAEAGQWDAAVAAFTAVHEVDPGYQDVPAKLDDARHQQRLAGLRAEARRLYQAGEWAAVLKVGERIQALDPGAADPGGLMATARAELEQAERAQRLATDYRAGLRLIDAGQWREAAQKLELVVAQEPGFGEATALLARARRELSEAEPASPPPPIPSALDGPGKADPAGRRQPSAEPARPPAAALTIRQESLVHTVAFSPDGRWLATGSAGGILSIWDARTGRPGPALKGSRLVLDVTSVAFASDSARLAAASKDGNAWVWDAASGQVLGKYYSGGAAFVYGVAFSPDGRWLATASGSKPTRIWDVTSMQIIREFTVKKVFGVAFSPDGRWLATGGKDGTSRIWDASSGQELSAFHHGRPVRAVVFSPDGLRLGTASDDKTARVLDIAREQQERRLPHGGPVRAVAFSPDGLRLATASDDRAARVWDIASGQEEQIFSHGGPVRAVAFSPDGHRLATASGNAASVWALGEEGQDD
jgi:WD40 repeat protein/tetratricopeptide (TPR) repeat protein